MSNSPQGQPSPVRYPLPDERQGVTFKFKLMASRVDPSVHRTVEDDLYEKEVDNPLRVITGYCTVSVYKDSGVPGEVFLIIGKEGHELHGWADKWSRMFSLLLQYGVDPRLIYESMKFQSFEPSGLTNSAKVPLCKSIPDLIVRWMEATFPPTAKLDKYEAVLDAVVEQ